MFRRLASFTLSVLTLGAVMGSLATACSKAEEPDDDATPARDSGARDPDGNVPGLPPTDATVGSPAKDGGTTTADTGSTAGIQGPSFNIASISSISGTFVTDKSPVNDVQTNATVTWSFKIENITPPPSSTATWSAQATNVVGGNMSDFPPVTGLALTLNAAPSPAQWEFYGDDFGSPRNYVLVQYGESHIVDFHFYRRVIDDSEPTPVADKPRNVVYTVQ